MSAEKDLVRLVEGQRPTDDEKRKLFEHLAVNLRPSESKKVQVRWIVDTYRRAKELMSVGDEIKGLKTGYPTLDKITRGIKPSDIIVLFGRTSEGKSQLAQNIALNIAREGDPVMFIGLEMSDEENSGRFLTMTDGEEDLPIAYPKLDNITYKSIDGILAAAKEENVALVVLDHIHALPLPPGNTKADQIEAAMYILQAASRKYQIPILVVSHVSREAYGSPELKDLKGSSALEQVASIAISLLRYDMDDTYKDEIGRKNVLQVQVRKNRNGPLGGLELYVKDNLRIVETKPVTWDGTTQTRV